MELPFSISSFWYKNTPTHTNSFDTLLNVCFIPCSSFPQQICTDDLQCTNAVLSDGIERWTDTDPTLVKLQCSRTPSLLGNSEQCFLPGLPAWLLKERLSASGTEYLYLEPEMLTHSLPHLTISWRRWVKYLSFSFSVSGTQTVASTREAVDRHCFLNK